MNLSILVTGGAGFIGANVVKRLVQDRCHVVALDNFDVFYDPAVKHAHWEEVISGAPHGYRPELLEMDIRDGERLKRLFADREFDVLLHLAARAGVRPSIADPSGYMDANVTGTARLYEAMRGSKVRQVLYASSSSVYGSSTEAPFSEDATLTEWPISPYAASKRAAELLTYTFARLEGWRAMSLRFFTVFGPWQRPDLAIHKFTRLMLEGRPIPVFGDGSMQRDHTYIGDIVEGIMQALQWLLVREDGEHEVVNLGHDAPVRLDALIAALEGALGQEAVIERLPVPPGDVPMTCADLTKAKVLLGYAPTTSLEEGLGEFVAWFRGRY